MVLPTNTSPYGNGQNFSPMSSGASRMSSGTNPWQVLFGKPEQNYQQSLLGNEQQPGYQQLLNAGQRQGAGGAFGDSADYYRNLLSNDSEDMDAFAAPELRRFREQTVPGIAEQFAGMGSGGLSSSGFRNAAVGAGADLGERLGAQRAQLRQQGASGLQNIGEIGLRNYNENIHRPASFGLAGNFAEGLGEAAGGAITGGIGSGLSALKKRF